jgi:hypothetical protein
MATDDYRTDEPTDELPTWDTSVDVFLPDDTARAVVRHVDERATGN